jgi:hypothetical protein
MAIEITRANWDSQKIEELTYSDGTVKIHIIVKSYNVVSTRDENNVGSIIEKYRSLKEEEVAKASEYWEQKSDVLNNYLNKNFPNPWPDFVPDYISIVGTTDDLRNGFINGFANNIVSH